LKFENANEQIAEETKRASDNDQINAAGATNHNTSGRRATSVE
jgi:hypothetical protein